jgi:hypothetical protein
MSLAKECYAMKLDLLTHATVVEDAIRFVTERTKLASRNNDDEESKEDNHDNQELEEESLALLLIH